MFTVMHAQHGLSGRHYMTLLVLAHHADDDTGLCWPGQRAISFLARQSPRTTVRILAELAQAGWISTEAKASRRGTNLYTLSLRRLESLSVRHQKRCKNPVQKPVDKLWKSCGSDVQKKDVTGVGGANRGNGIIKEVLGKNRVVQGKAERPAARGLKITPAFPVFADAEMLEGFLRGLCSASKPRGRPLNHVSLHAAAERSFHGEARAFP